MQKMKCTQHEKQEKTHKKKKISNMSLKGNVINASIKFLLL